MTEKILIIEDEVSLQETLAYNFRKQGYEVETAGDGLQGLEAARRIHPDLIILDIMLPGMDGYEVCRTLRQEMKTPVIMLTARDDEIDRVVGLEVGADDYMSKPFSMRELTAQVKAILRRVRMERETSQTSTFQGLTFGDLVIDLNRHEVSLRGVPVTLKPKEFELLTFLAQNRGTALSRETVLQRVWGWDYIGDSRTVDVHVRWLREKIEADPTNPTRIVTVRGAGYRFEG
ncbi:MAG TPA: response regulator transcription factor [Anaerolineaceae bacterium]|nr:response regulator transcription factor [Anaerolineaceae bacterium]HPN52697.1 response regulator transcription factor [Anaerolineaceae bacterium]